MPTYRFGSAVTQNPLSTFTKCVAVCLLGTAAVWAAPPAPCPTAPLSVYLAPPISTDGCTIGALVYSQWKYLAFGNTILPPTDLQITPTIDVHGTGFAISALGAPPWFATFFGRTDVEIMYIAKSIDPTNTFNTLYTEVNGAVTPPGFDQVVELFCPGGTTLPPDQTCPGTPPGVHSLYVGLGSATTSFANVNSIAVLKDMDANALQGGNARIDSVKNQLNITCVCR